LLKALAAEEALYEMGAKEEEGDGEGEGVPMLRDTVTEDDIAQVCITIIDTVIQTYYTNIPHTPIIMSYVIRRSFLPGRVYL
jgi:hypothetical protein